MLQVAVFILAWQVRHLLFEDMIQLVVSSSVNIDE